MSKNAFFGLMVATVLTFAVGVNAADKKESKLKCPVSGHAAAKSHAADYKGGQVYFCCDDCPKEFAANTAKYAAKANAQLVATKQYKEMKCPLTGKPLNPAMAVKVNGVKVLLCCGGCKGKVTKATDEEKLVLIFSDKAFDKCFEKVEKK